MKKILQAIWKWWLQSSGANYRECMRNNKCFRCGGELKYSGFYAEEDTHEYDCTQCGQFCPSHIHYQ